MNSSKSFIFSFLCLFLLSMASSCLQLQDDYLYSLKAEAKAGDSGAQNDLGVYYLETQDFKEAFKWFQKSAEQDCIYAYNNLGLCYLNGLGVEQDTEKAIHYYTIAADKGSSDAELMLGMIYQFDNTIPSNPEECIRWYERAVSHNQYRAALNLGTVYLNGEFGTKNDSLALYWIREAANHGIPQAQYLIGQCYLEGTGVPCDYNLSTQWFRKAAEQGLMEAQYALSMNYHYGLGVEKNPEMEKYWQDQANEQRGIAENAALLSQIKTPETSKKHSVLIEPLTKKNIKTEADKLYQKGFQMLFENSSYKANNEAIDCLTQAALKGNKNAKVLLAYCYATGLSVYPSKLTAASLFVGKGQIKYSIGKEIYTIDFEIFEDGSYDKQMNLDILK